MFKVFKYFNINQKIREIMPRGAIYSEFCGPICETDRPLARDRVAKSAKRTSVFFG